MAIEDKIKIKQEIQDFTNLLQQFYDVDTATTSCFVDQIKKLETYWEDILIPHLNGEEVNFFRDLFLQVEEEVIFYRLAFQHRFQKKFDAKMSAEDDMEELTEEESNNYYLSKEFLNFLDLTMVGFKRKLHIPADGQKTSMKNEWAPIRLSKHCNINEIPTIFYNYHKDNKLSTTKENLKRVLLAIIRDHDGNPISINTLNDIFNDSKVESRSKKV